MPGVDDRLEPGNVGRVGPVVQRDADVDERVAERRLVPVEHRVHPVGVGGIELAVVELVVVVEDRRVPAGRHRRRQPVADLLHRRRRVGQRGEIPPLLPALHLALQEPVGPAEVGEVDGGGIDGVQVGEGVDDGEPDAPADVGVVGHRRRARRPR